MYIRYTFIYYIYEVLFKLSFSFSCPFPFPFPFQYKTGAYLLQMGGVTLRWHTPRLRLFNRGWRQDHRNLSKKLEDPRKNRGKWSNTSQKCRSKHTWNFPIQEWCILLAYGGGKIVENTLEDPNKTWEMEQHKPKVKIKTYMELPIQDWCILLAYGGGKIVENTLEDPNKTWKMEQHKPKVQVKTYMELSNTRLVHTFCIWGRSH